MSCVGGQATGVGRPGMRPWPTDAHGWPGRSQAARGCHAINDMVASASPRPSSDTLGNRLTRTIRTNL